MRASKKGAERQRAQAYYTIHPREGERTQKSRVVIIRDRLSYSPGPIVFHPSAARPLVDPPRWSSRDTYPITSANAARAIPGRREGDKGRSAAREGLTRPLCSPCSICGFRVTRRRHFARAAHHEWGSIRHAWVLGRTCATPPRPLACIGCPHLWVAGIRQGNVYSTFIW